MPTVDELVSKYDEISKMCKDANTDWSIPNAKRRLLSEERAAVHKELLEARAAASQPPTITEDKPPTITDDKPTTITQNKPTTITGDKPPTITEDKEP
ncbi:hypothetical protein FALBO_4087 [Fusarium albosuccineum]|uniref:Uncharacterized protein n=1 Tax=Fusarium albosuccineum TaxID=1237068 RepID=A0A8H4PGN8_9HYPO|nr:hypothetical protein FALBO_4087 [Fusarium albosuccineum]